MCIVGKKVWFFSYVVEWCLLVVLLDYKVHKYEEVEVK